MTVAYDSTVNIAIFNINYKMYICMYKCLLFLILSSEYKKLRRIFLTVITNNNDSIWCLGQTCYFRPSRAHQWFITCVSQCSIMAIFIFDIFGIITCDHFLISFPNIYCGCFKPHRDGSNEFPKSMFLSMSMNNTCNESPNKPHFSLYKMWFTIVWTC